MKYNFEELYEKLKKDSVELNELYNEAMAERKKINRISLLICLIVDILIILVFFKGMPRLEGMQFLFMVVPVLIVDILILGLSSLFAKKGKEYVGAYKQNIMKSLIENFYDQLEYFPEKGMPRAIYKEALYNEYYDEYHSDDYFEAKIDDKYLIDMAEVKTIKEEKHTDSNGNTTTTHTTVFHGLFAKILFDKSINCDFRIGRESKISAYKNRLEMDSSEFEKQFNVYTSNPIVGMQLLTADVMEEILEFQNKTKTHFDIFIRENNLYIRFHCGSMFEIRNLKKGILDEKSLRYYYSILEFVDNLSRKLMKVIHETEI